MIVVTQQVQKIMKKARKLEREYDALMEKANKIKPLIVDGVVIISRPLGKANRIKRSYMNLAKKYPDIIK